MKGIAQIVGVIMVIIIGVGLVSLVSGLFFNTFNTIEGSGDATVNSSMETLSSCMRAESVSGNLVYLRNCGSGIVTKDTVGVYIDDASMTASTPTNSIAKDEIMVITLDISGISLGKHTLRVTNPNYVEEIPIEAVLDSGVVSLRKAYYE
jgi:hypothetical protein